MGRLLLALLLLLAACPARVSYPECKLDSDCSPHGQVCASGSCRECREDADCAAAAGRPLCRDALCAAKPQCAGSGECAPGEKCAGDRCVPECSAASAAADCGAGRTCRTGRCAAEEECGADADCGDGQACVNQRCAAQGELLASRPVRPFGDCNLTAVYFGFDEATLSPEARRTLEEDWQCLQTNPFRRVILAGHTDERGTTEYNLALGMRRSDAVKRYLAGLGAEGRKLKGVSYGKERAAAAGHDDSTCAKSRRVELVPEP